MSILSEVTNDYIRNHRECAEKELHWFEIQRTFEKAVELAAFAKGPSGKRFSHQRRIPKAVLSESHHHLSENSRALRKCRSFEELHEIISGILLPIPGIGKLTIYDTALRIGAWLRLEPVVVFLHAGTSTGAKALGLDTSRGRLDVSELPVQFRKLRPREIEDVFCIYKAVLMGGSIPKRKTSARC